MARAAGWMAGCRGDRGLTRALANALNRMFERDEGSPWRPIGSPSPALRPAKLDRRSRSTWTDSTVSAVSWPT